MPINLTTGIAEWFIDAFEGTLYHVCQQKDSKFAQAVRVVPLLNAEDKAFDTMGMLTLEEKTGRNVDTPTMDLSTQRRWVSTTPYHQSVLLDKDDDLSMIVDPQSDIVQDFHSAVNRQKDDIIIAAFEATVNAGRRTADSTITWASQNGNTKYTTAAAAADAANGTTTGGRTIPHDCVEGNCSASDTGMTVEKIELIKEYMAFNNVPEDIPVWCAISPGQATDLFGQTEYTNIDYAMSKPIATGRIVRNFHGINWIVSPRITRGTSNDVDSNTNVYECWAWAQDGIILGIQDNVSIRISEVETKSYSQRVYVHMNMGAMRRDEDKVIKIECQ